MRDLRLWDNLHLLLSGKRPLGSELFDDLRQLAAEPLNARLPFLGMTVAALDRRLFSPEEAAVALRTLAGATGFSAWQTLVAHLDEETPEAFDALRESAADDAGRWVHALSHPQPSIRRRAVLEPPTDFDPGLLVLNLADPESADAVRTSALGSAIASESSIPLVLHVVARGLLSHAEGAAIVASFDWKRRLGAIVDDLRYWSAKIPEDLDGDGLLAWVARPDHGADTFTQVLALFAEGTSGDASDETRSPFDDVATWLDRFGNKTVHTRVALAALRALPRVEGPQAVCLLHLAMMRFPQLAGASPLDLELRHAAARRLAVHPGQWRIARPLTGVTDADLEREGAPDLSVIAGLLGLAEQTPYRHLEERYAREVVIEAFIANPMDSVAIFGLTGTRKSEEAAAVQLIRAAFEHPSWEPRRRAVVLAELARLGRGTGLRVIGELHHFGNEVIVAVIGALLEAKERDPATPDNDRNERIAAMLARQIGKRLAGEVLTTILSAPKSQREGHFAIALVEALSRQLNTKTFVSAITSLEPDELAAAIRLLDLAPAMPLGKEMALAEALRSHALAEIREWAASRATETRAKSPAPADENLRPLSDAEVAGIAGAAPYLLPNLLRACLEGPKTRVCEALTPRVASDKPNAIVCAALLASHDDPKREVLPLLGHYLADTTAFVGEIDRALVPHAHRPSTFLASIWLYRWDARLADLERHFPTMFESHDEPSLGFLELALVSFSGELRRRAWAAVDALIKRARWRGAHNLMHLARAGLIELAVDVLLMSTSAPTGSALAALEEAGAHIPTDPKLSARATSILGTIFSAREPTLVGLLAHHRARVAAVIGELPPQCQKDLRPWIAADGVSRPGHHLRDLQRSASAAELAEVQASTDIEWLSQAVLRRNVTLAEEAALRLVELGQRARLVELLLSLPPALPQAAVVVAFFPDDAVELSTLRDVVSDAEQPAILRFYLGLALAERGENLVQALIDALSAPLEVATGAWFRERDRSRLAAVAGTVDLDLALAPSPHPVAYQPALAALLERETPPLEVLEDFLRRGTDRARDLRLRVAGVLLANGLWSAIAVLLPAAYRDNALVGEWELLASAPPTAAKAAVQGVLTAGVSGARAARLVGHITYIKAELLRVELLLELVRQIDDEAGQKRALNSLPKLGARRAAIRDLAEVFSWGVDLGRELTGKLFSIELIGGRKLGYTRLDEPRIFVNPLPLLRRERNGREIVKALIAHELGHHVYHASDRGKELWRQAAREGLTGVFNLVLDEHLERNLRANRESVGNGLKQLGAYAFQHQERETSAIGLLHQLGASAVPVLIAAQLRVARKAGCVKINTGSIFSELETGGLSFGRFVRALRMGLGDRHRDPRVAEALELFRGKRFRRSTMDELYAIAKALRTEFGDECQILESVGQDGVFEPDAGEFGDECAGIDDGDIQEEIERIKNPDLSGPKSRSKGGGRLWVNVSDDVHFNRITQIEKLPHSRLEERRLASEVARHSRRFRTFLERLGLQRIRKGGRLSGRAIDRTRLSGLVTHRDPRVLVARENQIKSDLFLGIVVDCSGSMHGECMEKARRFAALLASAGANLDGVDVRIFGFTDTVIYDAGDAQRCAAHSLASGGGNNDAAGLWHASRVALKSRRKARLLVMISDGLPTECSVEALRSLVQRLVRRERIACAQIAVRSLREVAFDHYIEVTEHDMNESVRRFGEIVAALVWKTMR